MHTIKLKISDEIYNKLMSTLRKFGKDELQIISEDEGFTETKKYLERELEDINSGKANFFSVEEAEDRFEKVIKKHENPS